jgi:ribosome-binding protein aMBF1 (putative translation factor)
MPDTKGTDALEFIRKKYGNYPEFDEGVAKARTDLMVGKMIYDARQEAGLTQTELATLVGTTQSVISRLEDADYDGHSMPMLNRIAAALNKRIDIQFVPVNSHPPQPTQPAR